jgi:hypothetical protein
MLFSAFGGGMMVEARLVASLDSLDQDPGIGAAGGAIAR